MDHLLSMELSYRKTTVFKNFGAWRKQIVLGIKLLGLVLLGFERSFSLKKNFEFCSLKT